VKIVLADGAFCIMVMVFNANDANRANTAKKPKTFAPFARFALFALELEKDPQSTQLESTLVQNLHIA
jgi:hypothetical protein